MPSLSAPPTIFTGLQPHRLPRGPSALPLPQAFALGKACPPRDPNTAPLGSPHCLLPCPSLLSSSSNGMNCPWDSLCRGYPPFELWPPVTAGSRPMTATWQRPGTGWTFAAPPRFSPSPLPVLLPCPWRRPLGMSPQPCLGLSQASQSQGWGRGVGCSVGGHAARRVPQGEGGPGGRAADLRSGLSRRVCSRGDTGTGSCPGS